MIESMEGLGYGKLWTLLIGYGELAGVLGLSAGVWIHQVKNISALWLFPFAVGALMVHFAHNDYKYFYAALFCCVSCMVLLATDKYFKVIL
jgi:hypothetical protein